MLFYYYEWVPIDSNVYIVRKACQSNSSIVCSLWHLDVTFILTFLFISVNFFHKKPFYTKFALSFRLYCIVTNPYLCFLCVHYDNCYFYWFLDLTRAQCTARDLWNSYVVSMHGYILCGFWYYAQVKCMRMRLRLLTISRIDYQWANKTYH